MMTEFTLGYSPGHVVISSGGQQSQYYLLMAHTYNKLPSATYSLINVLRLRQPQRAHSALLGHLNVWKNESEK